MSFKYLRNIRNSAANLFKRDLSLVSNWEQNTVKNMEAVKTIKSLGYAFNAEGELRKITENGEPGDEPFQFNVCDQHQGCQAHYEELGTAVTDYVYHLLDTEEKMTRLPVPKDSKDGTFIFVSSDYDKKVNLMVLIHGSGAVRAGQWARSLIINNCLDMGTQIPYIRKAISRNFGVLIMNTNDNYLTDGKEIPKCNTAEQHATYVWETYVMKTKASSIAIVAHSYGGVVTATLADKFKKDFEKRVKAIALTDSVHGYSNLKVTPYMKQVARNWISSEEPLDSPMNTPDFDITRVSAGHPRHEMTSYSCMESVFQYIDIKFSM